MTAAYISSSMKAAIWQICCELGVPAQERSSVSVLTWRATEGEAQDNCRSAANEKVPHMNLVQQRMLITNRQPGLPPRMTFDAVCAHNCS